MAALPDIQHEILPLPYSRISKLLEAGEKVCFPCMIHKPQANQKAQYSQPVIIYPPHVLITTATTKRRLLYKYGEPIPLQQLLADNNYLLALHKSRRFGDTLQPLLDANPAPSNRMLNSNADLGPTTLLRMVSLERAEYTIDYPSILRFYNLQNTALEAIDIAENQQERVLGAIGCSASAPDDFAKRALAQINPALKRQVLHNPEYKQRMSRWFGQHNKDYWSNYKQLILQQPQLVKATSP